MFEKASRLIRSSATRAALLIGNPDIPALYDRIGTTYPDDPLFYLQVPLEFEGFRGQELTGRAIRSLGYKIANALLAEGTLDRNMRVIVAKANHPDYFFYLLSTICAGGIPVSVNRSTGWGFIGRTQEVTGARIILTDADTLARYDEELQRVLDRDVRILVVGKTPFQPPGGRVAPDRIRHLFPLIEAAPAVPPPARTLGSDTPVAIFHTSGTTGTPKLCIWDRRNLTRIWKLTTLLLPLTSNSKGMITVPFSHALFFALQPAGTLCGAWTYMMSQFDPKACLAAIERHRITHYMGFPYTYMRMAAEDLSQYDLRSMMLWSTGADSAHAAHIHKMTQVGTLRLGPFKIRGSVFIDSYGSTEIGAGGILQLWTPWVKPVPCLQGKPLPTQFAVRIVDRQWQDLSIGQVGRILVKSTPHFAGYWNNHSAWAEGRIDGWWWAGDVGKVDAQGRLWFLDREVHVVHTAAGPLYTLPVEERLLMHEQVMEAAVVQRTARFEMGTGEAVAYVVPQGYLRRDNELPVSKNRLQAELLEFANAALGEGPRLSEVRIVPLGDLPLGVTGKVLKHRLLENEGRRAGAAQMLVKV
jgi:acyl-coenzyme A synthetase/AMP-(fatty) acid ligase